jgi:hypothetical protein
MAQLLEFQGKLNEISFGSRRVKERPAGLESIASRLESIAAGLESIAA